MNNKNLILLILIILLGCNHTIEKKSSFSKEEYAKMKELPGEYSEEQILNGEYQWPPSPERSMEVVANSYFNPDAFGKAPAPGIHPRILFSPEDVVKIRNRVNTTETGKLAINNLRKRQAHSLHKKNTASYNVYYALLAGDLVKARQLLEDYNSAGESDGVSWHHRSQFNYIMVLEAFDCLLRGDAEHGKELALAITNLGKIYQENLDRMDKAFEDAAQNLNDEVNQDGNAMQSIPRLNSDTWRSGRRDAIGGEPFFAYMYDFAYNWMSKEQQATCRNMLNDYMGGKTAMGAHIPHHFRDWNWIAVGSGLLLNSLATEGEEGYDERVYELQKEIQTDYIKYGWSEKGMSKEAVGYTQFGLTWSIPAMVAMARRGHNLWNQKRWYNSVSWYANCLQSGGGRFMSHGDGGRGCPKIITMLAWKQAYPKDPLVDFVLQESIKTQNKEGDNLADGRGYLLYQLVFASDASDTDYELGKELDLPKTLFEPERASLITRSEWGKDEVQLQLECRIDQIAPSHQHADRGHFSMSGAGRVWAVENFRGVETRHHNCVIIDGKGQGYMTPPGKWLNLVDKEDATFGVLDAKYAYDWYWHSTLSGYADKNQPRRYFKRWERFTEQTDKWLEDNPDFDWKGNIDRSPVVEKYYNGYESGDPRMWDEYARPVRVEHNPVEKAFRSAGLVRGEHPYALIIDDIQKDNEEHLYEWIMMVDYDVRAVKIDLDEIILGGETEQVSGTFGVLQSNPEKGEPQLLVKVLNRTIPDDVFANPQIRLETFEFKDARGWPEGRSFGLTKRLIIPSRSINPGFKVLLFPHYQGDEKPDIVWNEDKTSVKVEWKDQKDVISFKEGMDGRTTYTITRNGKAIAEI